MPNLEGTICVLNLYIVMRKNQIEIIVVFCEKFGRFSDGCNMRLSTEPLAQMFSKISLLVAEISDSA